MRTIYLWAAAPLLGMLAGCATPLNSAQKAELEHYRAESLVVEEKNPGVAAGLGLLPGGGSFYARSYGFGVVNLLFWPLSVLWDPVSGYDGAEAINYQATRAHVRALREADMNRLDNQLASEEIDLKRYTLEKRKVEEKYSAL